MNGWTVVLSKSARKEFRLLDEGAKQDATEILKDLTEEGPVVVPAIELSKYPDTWRARFHHGRYRIIYEVSRTRKRIHVIRILPRSIAYIGMKKPGAKWRKPKPNPSGKQRPMTKAESELGMVCQGGSGSCVNPPKFMLELPNYDPGTGEARPGSRKIFLCGVHAGPRAPG